ncbi:MAG TPA: hypothetical protein PKA13_21520 [Geminicoccaceae bacterium]|nr:hypothetical protein [Geminicoccus sp.]HMU52374.1 hypothetical protein [Geminicoccaceae bacterium]
MSLRDCIGRAVEGGELDPDRAREALGLFDELEARYRGSMGPGEASRRARRETLEQVKAATVERIRRQLLQAKASAEIAHNLRTYRNARGRNDMAFAMTAHIDTDETARFSSAEQRRKAVLGMAHRRLDKFLSTFKRDLLGRTRNRALLSNVVREAYGDETGDAAAKELAKAWLDTAEELRQRRNAAGGATAKREKWGLPQAWNAEAVRRAGYRGWRDAVLPELDRVAMIDERTGLPFSDEALEVALRNVFETITHEGWNKITPSGVAGGRSIAARHTDSRFLALKDGAAWERVHARFGDADVFSTMMAHLDVQAREIAAMEVLGPNPTASLRWMEQAIRKQASGDEAAANRANKRISQAWDLWAHYIGSANRPVDGRVARGFQGLRNVLTSAQLGSAFLAALPGDTATQTIAAKHAGLPVTRTLGRVLKLFLPGSEADRRLAIRAGLIAEDWSAVASGQARYVGEVTGPELSRRLADGVLRATLLSPWTQAGRWAFGMEFMSTLADHAAKPFDALPTPLRNTLGRYGIGEGAWDSIRSARLHEHDGVRFLRPEEIEELQGLAPSRARELATRMLEMIQTETDFAVPTASLRGRSAFIGDVQPGSLKGELLRSAAMYKSFPITIMMTHLRRGVVEAMSGRWAYGGGYLAAFLVSSTLAGAASFQMREVGKGRDPMSMQDPRFWLQSVLQGGGLGLFGDFVFQDYNRFGGGFAETLSGSVVGLGGTLLRSGQKVATSRGDDLSPELLRLARQYTPGGTIWYARLAYERLVLDQLARMTDPKAMRRMATLERDRLRNYGQRYWWRPGRAEPDRAPAP